MSSAPVHIVRGTPTTFVEGRRLLLQSGEPGATFELTDDLRSELPTPNRDRSRQMVWRADLFGEPTSNRLAALVAPLLPWKRFWIICGALAASGLVLSIWSLVLAGPVQIVGPSWSSLATHYLILGGILAWHELGHLAAARRAGLRVDGLGAGLYLVFPALFSNISLIALAPYRDRMRIYAAGVAFQAMLAIVLSGVLMGTEAPLARFAVVANLSTLVLNMVPGMKLDGHRMVEEVSAQPWSAPYRRPLRILTVVSTIAVMTLGVASLCAWLLMAAPDLRASPTVLKAVITVIPAALLCLYLYTIAKGVLRRRD